MIKKRILGFLGLLIVGLAVFVFFVNHSLNQRFAKKYTVSNSEVAINRTEEALQNGKRLFRARGCADCHGTDLGGKKVIDALPAGVLFGTNLTKGKGGTGGQLKDEDIIRAIHNGVSRDGFPLKWMPSEEYTGLSAEELSDLTAYITSAASVDRETLPSSYGPITSLLLFNGELKLAAELIDHNKKPVKGIVPEVSKNYGEYIANTCKGCHGSDFSGGPIPGVPPSFPAASNITSDKEKGIGKYTEADFITAMTKGK
ncbi:MAG: cytochrome c, partial [Leptospiraceae bacterium]|nr:cytochrome c [Leptospiraceae bacterium]